MTDLQRTQKQLEELKETRTKYLAAKHRVENQQEELEAEIKATDAELSRLALEDAFCDTGAQARFLERFRHPQEMLALQNMTERAIVSLEPLLNDKARSTEIRRLGNIVTLAQYWEQYDSLLEKLNNSYDEHLEQELVRAASYACISSEDRNADIYEYHCKHGIPTNEYDPLHLEPPRPGMQV